MGACPQRSFATLDDGERALTVANRGLAEVEAVREGQGDTSLAVTLLRAVGWLSRGDLCLRPGDAGPPLPTPGAQVPGPLRAELSLRVHPVGDPERIPAAHRFAYPPIAFPGGGLAGGPLGDRASLVSVSEGAVVLSAIEPRPAGGALLRGYNASDQACHAEVRWLPDPGRRLEAVDLGERPLGTPVEAGVIRLELRAWQLFSVRVG